MQLTLATKITIFRILLVPFFIVAVLYYSPEKDYLRFVALVIFCLASFSDFFDGYLARRYQQESKIGSLLDPLADKLLLMSGFICIYKIGILFETVRFPIWLIVAVISRDVILLLGVLVVHLMQKSILIEATMWGKVNTASQMACIIGILLQWSWTVVFWYIVLIAIVVSMFEYSRIGMHILGSEITS